jgi:hypothetical protein
MVDPISVAFTIGGIINGIRTNREISHQQQEIAQLQKEIHHPRRLSQGVRKSATPAPASRGVDSRPYIINEQQGSYRFLGTVFVKGE